MACYEVLFYFQNKFMYNLSKTIERSDVMQVINQLLGFLLTPTTLLFYIAICSIYFWGTIDNDPTSNRVRKGKKWVLVVGLIYFIFSFIVPMMIRFIW